MTAPNKAGHSLPGGWALQGWLCQPPGWGLCHGEPQVYRGSHNPWDYSRHHVKHDPGCCEKMHCTHAVLLPLPSTRHVQTGMMRFGMLNMQEEHTVFTATGLLRCQCGVRTIATANSEYADAERKSLHILASTQCESNYHTGLASMLMASTLPLCITQLKDACRHERQMMWVSMMT